MIHVRYRFVLQVKTSHIRALQRLVRGHIATTLAARKYGLCSSYWDTDWDTETWNILYSDWKEFEKRRAAAGDHIPHCG